MIYEPVQSKRMFTKTDRYSHVDWSDFNAAATAFEDRINNWYIEPATELAESTGHYAFSIMAINCLLIDTFSQFASGQLHSSASTFKKFVTDNLPSFNATLTSTILHDGHSRQATLSTVADVLYHGFRCGILHQAHIPLYGVIDPGGPPFEEKLAGYTIYSSNGADCPTVVVNPLQLLEELKGFFGSYVANLKNADARHDQLRDDFRRKFADSFGIQL